MNNIINISERLKCVAGLVNKGARVADIGTDHAYLPIYLVQNGISNKVYACDVRKEPLRRAKLHIDEYGLSDKITTQLCDGLKGINKGDVDTVTICGMGGKLMKNILKAGIDKLGDNTQLVLSAQSELRDFRKYLLETGIYIKSEHMLLEDGKYYFIFDCVYNTQDEYYLNVTNIQQNNIYENAAAAGDIHNNDSHKEDYDKEDNDKKKITAYAEEELRYGRYLLDNKSEVLYEYLNKELTSCNNIRNSLINNKEQSISIKSRIHAIDEDIAVINKALGRWKE
ncbi:MAG: tRNA (adenine(22)-N(1))-methyltransferase [Lachnospira sp.]|uniref:tRNA (adenine(22)-N(1))-methyltransferase n=1 Tax=Lachnospira sp. TaxID=2049031 RepID=UPI003A4A1763